MPPSRSCWASACAAREESLSRSSTAAWTATPPILSYLQLREQLAGTEPDLVLLFLHNSDLVQEPAYRKLATYDDDGRLVGVTGVGSHKLRRRIREWLTRNTYLTRLAIYLWRSRRFSPDDVNVARLVSMTNPQLLAYTLEGDTRDRSAEWDDLFESIRSVRDQSNDMGAEFALVAYPWGHQVNDTEWVPGRWRFMPQGARRRSEIRGDRGAGGRLWDRRVEHAPGLAR